MKLPKIDIKDLYDDTYIDKNSGLCLNMNEENQLTAESIHNVE